MKRSTIDIGNPYSRRTSTPCTPASGGQKNGGSSNPLPLRHAPDYRASGGQKRVGASTYFRLPACDSMREEKTYRCTLPPSLLAIQLSACLQIQTLIHILLVVNGFSSPFSKGRPRGILKKKNLPLTPSLQKRGDVPFQGNLPLTGQRRGIIFTLEIWFGGTREAGFPPSRE